MPTPGDQHERIDKLEGRAPGQDTENPYEDIDTDTLPPWWQKAIKEHRTYDLRPYRPPRFQDGELYPEVKRSLEETIGEKIRLACFDVDDNVWTVLVDGETISELKRVRSPEGYSVIEMTSDQFRDAVIDSG